MKLEKQIIPILLAAIVVLGTVVAWQINRLQTSIAESAERDYELAIGMGHMQAWMDKLYFSGTEGNWPLADFYLHELEETTEEMVQANLVKHKQPLTPLFESLLIPEIERLEDVVDHPDSELFLRHYDQLVRACNDCHNQTGYGYIQMQRPESPAYTNQRFAP